MNETDAYSRGFYAVPQSDGFRLHSIDLARVGGYEASLEDLPTEAMIARAVALRETGSRPRLDEIS